MVLIPTVQTEQPLRLLSLLPYPIPRTGQPQPAFDEGPAVYLASQLAVEAINNRTDILPGYTVELIQGDCGCDLVNTLVISLFEHIIYNELNVHGVVGPGCSESTLFLGRQIAQPALEVLSLSLAGSEELGDRTIYPNSYSAIDSAEVYVEAIEAVAKSGEWVNVFVFHDLSRNFYTSIRTQLECTNSTTQYHFISLFDGNLRYTPDFSLPRQCKSVSRIALFLASADVISELICLFTFTERFQDVVYPNFQFVIVNRTPQSIIKDTSFLYENQTINCTAKQISDHLHGSVFLEYRFTPSNPNVTTATGMTYTEFEALYNQQVKEFNNNNTSDDEVLPSVWASVYFDSTWALALALNNSRNELMAKIGLELSEYRPGHSNATAIMRKELERLEFNGVSGKFAIGSNGFVKRLVDIRQFMNGTFQRHDYYDSSTGNISNFEHEKGGVEYIKWNFIEVLVSDPVKGALLICLVLFVTLTIFAIHVVSTLNTNHPSIKATNPKLYHFAYVGTYVQSTATIIYIVGDTLGLIPYISHCFLLHFTVVAISTGSVLVFASLTAISFRIYRIFVHYMHPGMLIRDGFLLGFIIVTTSVYFICYFVVSLVYRPDESRVCVSTQGDTVTQRAICHYRLPQWILVSQIIPILITVLAVAFSLLSFKKVTIQQFKTNSIIIVCFFSFINTGVWILYYEFQVIGSSTNPSLGPVVGITGASLVVCLLFLYLPPSLPVLGDYYQAHLKKYRSPCCLKITNGMCAHNKDNANSNTDDALTTDDVMTTTDSMLYKYSYSKSQDDAIAINDLDPVCSPRANVQTTDDVMTTTDSMLYKYSYSKSQDDAIAINDLDPVCSPRANVQTTDDVMTTTDSMLYRYSFSKSQDETIAINDLDPVCPPRAKCANNCL